MDIHWLSSLWAKNAKCKPAESDGPTFGNTRHEFMFDSLMDPDDRNDRRNLRPFE